MEERVFTREELAGFDGREGRPAYVAWAGKVYDVSDSVMWEDGDHQEEHVAGEDLTDELENYAPHGADELDRFPIVGRLAE